jgi:Flp pilus assembly protein TadB
MKEPNEKAGAEDGYKRQLSNYIIYFWWILLVVISIGLSVHLISSESVSVITYIFVAIWVVILAKFYYKQISYYVGWVLEYISSVMVNSVN